MTDSEHALLADMAAFLEPMRFDRPSDDAAAAVLLQRYDALDDARLETEAQGFAMEALSQFVPDLREREDNRALLTPAQVEAVLRRMGWKPPGEQRAQA